MESENGISTVLFRFAKDYLQTDFKLALNVSIAVSPAELRCFFSCKVQYRKKHIETIQPNAAWNPVHAESLIFTYSEVLDVGVV